MHSNRRVRELRVPEAFRAALEQRLKFEARQQRTDINRLRKLVTFDRMLARLLVVAPNRWLLKGALALDFRFPGQFRSTRDADLGRWDEEPAATIDFRAVESVDLGDYFSFAIERTPALDRLLDGAAVRYRVTTELARRRFETVIVDLGFGDPPSSPSTILDGPDLLAFAEIEPIQVPAISLELHVAEKVHAYTRRYSRGRQSSRAKDLIDLVLIQANARLRAQEMSAALAFTFQSRKTQSLPDSLPTPPRS